MRRTMCNCADGMSSNSVLTTFVYTVSQSMVSTTVTSTGIRFLSWYIAQPLYGVARQFNVSQFQLDDLTERFQRPVSAVVYLFVLASVIVRTNVWIDLQLPKPQRQFVRQYLLQSCWIEEVGVESGQPEAVAEHYVKLSFLPLRRVMAYVVGNDIEWIDVMYHGMPCMCASLTIGHAARCTSRCGQADRCSALRCDTFGHADVPRHIAASLLQRWRPECATRCIRRSEGKHVAQHAAAQLFSVRIPP